MKDKNSSIAYLKMNKNPKANLESDEDYIRWSERCLNEAKAYFDVSYRCKDMILNGNRNALLTNVSFACELYFKYLLLINKVSSMQEHNLYNLYKKLPKRIQEDISQAHPCSNISRDEFDLELKDIGQAFIVFRYIYERKTIAYNLQFLMELLFTLHDLIHNNE